MLDCSKDVEGSERIKGLKEQLVSTPYDFDIERARYYTASYKATEEALPCMRAAKGLEITLRAMSIRIEKGEILVGAKGKGISAPLGIERGPGGYDIAIGTAFHGKEVKDLTFLDAASGRSPDFMKNLLSIPESEYKELTEEILPYWKGKDLSSYKTGLWKKAGVCDEGDPLSSVMALIDDQGHVTVGLKKVLDLGFKGIAAQAAERLAQLKPGEERYEQRKDFLEAVQVAAMAVCAHAARYAQLAEDMAGKAEDAERSELLEIAARCRRVPAEPAQSFMDALQSIWMTQAAVLISYGEDAVICPGRVDQFLYPYYKQDLAAGRITREQAIEAIQAYYLKASTVLVYGPNNITIGGIDRQGESAVNEVSYLMLEAHKGLKGPRYGLSVRISPEAPREFLIKACDTLRSSSGVAFYNDGVVIRDLLKDGYSLEDARNYSVVGCVELTGTGNNNGYSSSNGFHLTTVVEMALHEGHRFSLNWRRVGLATPPASEMKTFEDVKKAFAAQLSHCIDLFVKRADLKDQAFAEYFPTPLLSSTIEGCVESGLDITRGGAKYNHESISSQGLATVANSLTAIRWAVFEKKLVTMEELVNHLRNNFKDAEPLRQQLLRNAPKYGNSDPKGDEMAVWVAELMASEGRKHKRPMDGGPYRVTLVSSGTHAMEGLICGATPDGRLARQPVSNGISPANGTDVTGMTAALKSVAAACHPSLSDGTGLNMTINPGSIKSDEGLDKFVSLMEAYFELGGRQVQFNSISGAVLKDAQKNPANYPALMVKVSGYSYRFIDLSKVLQDDIIARTEFGC